MKKPVYLKKVVHTLTATALVATMTLGISISVSAAEYDLGNLTRMREYQSNFDDLVDSSGKALWAEPYIKDAYEYGIVNGKSSRKFDPNGTLTGAEAITIGARIHAFYKYGADADKKIDAAGTMPWPPLKDVYGKETDTAKWSELFPYSNAWYDKYVKYAMYERLTQYSTEGDKTFMNILEEPVTRRNMIALWSKLLQDKDMVKLNDISGIPDITSKDEFFSEILQFYSAGIIRGVDSKGTFNPNSDITRMECAAIFMNLVDPSRRTSGLRLTAADSYLIGDVPFSPSLDVKAISDNSKRQLLTIEAQNRFIENMLSKSKGFFNIDTKANTFDYDFTLTPLPEGYNWNVRIEWAALAGGTYQKPAQELPGYKNGRISGTMTSSETIVSLHITISCPSKAGDSPTTFYATYDFTKKQKSYQHTSPNPDVTVANWLDMIFPEDFK